MSADRWVICPQCKKVGTEQRNVDISKAKDSYGKVSEAQYRKAIVEAEKPLFLKETFREDYEQGTDNDGTYSVSYRGRCTHCGFSHSFKFSQNVLVNHQ